MGTGMQSDGGQVEAARRLFAEQRLPFPPLPVHLIAALRPAHGAVFATRRLLTHGPWNLHQWLAEFESEPVPADFAVVGFDGHGVNSWAVHHYVVSDGLGVFIQLPWGGAFLDEAPARAEIAAMFDWAAQLQAGMADAQAAGRVAAGRRLEVVASRVFQAGWRWLDAGADPSRVPWQPAAGMKAALLKEVQDAQTGR